MSRLRREPCGVYEARHVIERTEEIEKTLHKDAHPDSTLGNLRRNA